MERDYIIFTRTDKGMPYVITVADENDDRQRYPFAVICRIRCRRQLPNGMPTEAELNRASDLEDKLIVELERIGAIHMGHITGNGFVKAIFYSPAKAPELVTAKVGVLKKEALRLETRHDPEWRVYELEMAPGELEREQAANQQLLMTLKEQGDNSAIPRAVDFGAFFPSENERSSFIREAATGGFTLSVQATWVDDTNRFWCELNKTTAIDLDTICRETSYLRKLAQKHGGIYDGWATPVKK